MYSTDASFKAKVNINISEPKYQGQQGGRTK